MVFKSNPAQKVIQDEVPGGEDRAGEAHQHLKEKQIIREGKRKGDPGPENPGSVRMGREGKEEVSGRNCLDRYRPSLVP